MVCQQVVPVETGTADRWCVVQTSMRTVPVVLMEPGRKLGGTGLGVIVSATVSPFAQRGLDKAFGFAVGRQRAGMGLPWISMPRRGSGESL